MSNKKAESFLKEHLAKERKLSRFPIRIYKKLKLTHGVVFIFRLDIPEDLPDTQWPLGGSGCPVYFDFNESHPVYLGSGHQDIILEDYLTKHYPESAKADMLLWFEATAPDCPPPDIEEDTPASSVSSPNGLFARTVKLVQKILPDFNTKP